MKEPSADQWNYCQQRNLGNTILKWGCAGKLLKPKTMVHKAVASATTMMMTTMMTNLKWKPIKKPRKKNLFSPVPSTDFCPQHHHAVFQIILQCCNGSSNSRPYHSLLPPS
eukprot:12276912-Ditylum_brightwellii.AAC.1